MCIIWMDGKVSSLSGPGLVGTFIDFVIQKCASVGIQVTSVIAETVQYEVGDDIENWDAYRII